MLESVARLREEHDVIQRVLDGLQHVVDGGQAGSGRLIGEAVDFLAAFADRGHHAKEEEGLFPVLCECGLPREAGPLVVLGAEHEEGRSILRALRGRLQAAGAEVEAVADAGVREMLRRYVTLLHQHIDKENAVLFPFAERVMSAADDRRVLEAFAAVEEREGGQRARAALLDLGRAVARACHTDGRGEVRVPRTEDVMRRDVRAIGPGDSLARAVETMEGTGVRELPVVDGGVLVGVVTLRDLGPHWGQYEWTAVREAMTPRPVTVAPETPIATVARLLLEHCFNAVPVVRDGAVVGMIARSDLLRLLAEAWPWCRSGRQPSHA